MILITAKLFQWSFILDHVRGDFILTLMIINNQVIYIWTRVSALLSGFLAVSSYFGFEAASHDALATIICYFPDSY